MTYNDILYILLLVLPLIVFMAAIFDIYSYQIPNILSVILIAGFYVFAIANPNMTWGDIGIHTLLGVLALIVCFSLFCFGLFGGGDAKILAASSLWFGSQNILEYVFLVTLWGGILAVLVFLFRGQPCYPIILRFKSLSSLYFGNGNKRAMPYAVAIAAGLYVTLPTSEILKTVL
jgi:prepilin peptidase CpaA